jgi:mono/diheme cytochrome c family protein
MVLPSIIVVVTIAACATLQQREDRVPSSAKQEALSYKAPFGEARTAPPDIIEAGKALYEGKGRCSFCHGMNGKGTGPAAHMHATHAPKDLTDCTFQKERTDGELFWILKYGESGTGMQRLIPGQLSEEEGWKIVAYIRTFCTTSS